MIKEHLISVGFKDIAEIFNKAVRTVKACDTIYPEEIRDKIYLELTKVFPDLGIISMDYNHSRFWLKFPYTKDFDGIVNFDSGNINLYFKIVTKKTDKLKTVSKTRNKFFYTMAENPIRFEYADVSHNITKFTFLNSSPDNLFIKHEVKLDWYVGSRKRYMGNSIKEILESIDEYYPTFYREKIVDPFFEVLWRTDHCKREMLFRDMPQTIFDGFRCRSKFNQAIKDLTVEDKFNQATKVLTDWVIVSNLIRKSE